MAANHLLPLRYLLFCSFIINAQKLSVTGKISSDEDGKPLSLASVCINLTNHCATTNSDGLYKIEHLKPGTYQLTISSVGYTSESKEVKLDKADMVITEGSQRPAF